MQACYCRAAGILYMERQSKPFRENACPFPSYESTSIKLVEMVGRMSEFQAQLSAPGIRTSAGSGAARGCVGSVRASGENRGLPNNSALHMSHRIGWRSTRESTPVSRVSWDWVHVTAELSNVMPGKPLGSGIGWPQHIKALINMHMQMNISLSAPITAHPTSGPSRKAGTLGQIGEARNPLSWQAGCHGEDHAGKRDTV